MKNCEETILNLFKRRAEYLIKIQKRRRIIKSSSLIAFVFVFGLLSDLFFFNFTFVEANDSKNSTPQRQYRIVIDNNTPAPSEDNSKELRRTAQYVSKEMKNNCGFLYTVDLPDGFYIESADEMPVNRYEYLTFHNIPQTKEEFLQFDDGTFMHRIITYKKSFDESVRISSLKIISPLKKETFSYPNEDPNKTAVTIKEYSNLRIATFCRGGSYYSVEIKGLSDEEIVKLLESVCR